MKNTQVFIALLILCSIIMVGFYWFGYRPVLVRKECYEYAYGPDRNVLTKDFSEASDAYYIKCLRKNGLKDEG